MSELPIYTPSGAGSQIDMKNIIISEIIGWGGFKGRFGKNYAEVAGTQWLNGREVFKPLRVDPYLGDSSSEVYKFLESFGFTPEDLSSINSDVNENQDAIDKVMMQWTNSVSKEEDDWNFWTDYLKDRMTEFDSIVIHTGSIEYSIEDYPTEQDRPVVSMNSLGVTNLTPDDTYHPTNDPMNPPEPDMYNVYDEILTYPYSTNRRYIANPSRMSRNATVYLYKNGANVTSNFSYSFKRMIQSLLLIEKDIVDRVSIEAIRSVTYHEFDYDGDDFYESYEYEKVTAKETFDLSNFDIGILKKRHLKWVMKYRDRYPWDDEILEEQKESFVSAKGYSRWFWRNINEDSKKNIEQISNGLFYSMPDEQGYNFGTGWIRPSETGTIADDPGYTYDDESGSTNESFVRNSSYVVYMTVEGLKKSTQSDFGYLVSKFLDMKVIQKSEKSYFKKFFGGLIKAFVSFIDAVIGTMLKIPILKQTVELVLSVLGKMFSLSMEGAKAILTQIVMAIVIAVVSFFMPPFGVELASGLSIGLTAGVTSLSSVVSTISTGFSIYGAAMEGALIGSNIDEQTAERERLDTLWKNRDPESAIKTAFAGTMGSVQMNENADDIMYNKMFNPFFGFEQAIPAHVAGETYS